VTSRGRRAAPGADLLEPVSPMPHPSISRLLVPFALCVLGCTADRAPTARHERTESSTTRSEARVVADTSYRTRPGYVIDSAMPREELLRRFRADTRPVTRLEGGAASRDALVRAFFDALAASDAAALDRLLVTRDEWGWLVFPESPFSRPPYEQRPDAAWILHAAGAAKGRQRLLERVAGRGIRLVAHRCAPTPMREGPNRIWRDCASRVRRADGETSTVRLFGAILERGGRFKFLTYQNDL